LAALIISSVCFYSYYCFG